MNQELLNLINQVQVLWNWLVAHPDEVKVAAALTTAAWSFITMGLALHRITKIAKAAAAVADHAVPFPAFEQAPPTGVGDAGEVDANQGTVLQVITDQGIGNGLRPSEKRGGTYTT